MQLLSTDFACVMAAVVLHGTWHGGSANKVCSPCQTLVACLGRTCNIRRAKRTLGWFPCIGALGTVAVHQKDRTLTSLNNPPHPQQASISRSQAASTLPEVAVHFPPGDIVERSFSRSNPPPSSISLGCLVCQGGGGAHELKFAAVGGTQGAARCPQRATPRIPCLGLSCSLSLNLKLNLDNHQQSAVTIHEGDTLKREGAQSAVSGVVGDVGKWCPAVAVSYKCCWR